MAVRIEVLGLGGGKVRAAFYYAVPVPMQQPAAADANREPAGSKLSAGEITALKAGEIFEAVLEVDVNGMNLTESQTYLETYWTDYQATAAEIYKRRYQHVGRSWDGTTWSA